MNERKAAILKGVYLFIYLPPDLLVTVGYVKKKNMAKWSANDYLSNYTLYWTVKNIATFPKKNFKITTKEENSEVGSKIRSLELRLL